MEVKNYRIEGEMLIGGEWQKFVFETRALKPEHALERMYSELGSRHKLKRAHIRVKSIQEIPPDELRNPYIRSIALWKGPT